MDKYFNTEIYDPQYEKRSIVNLLQNEMTLIVGDFWGIQSFIFDRLATKNAAKVLRSKSAFIQIFTQILAEYICYKLDIDKKYILTTNAGKFEILAPLQGVDLSEIQKRVDEYFIKNFYGLSGVMVCAIEVSEEEWRSDYKCFREKVAQKVELAKFKKFDLQNRSPILEYDEGIDNQNLCKICNIRKKEDSNCHICNIFVELGKKLTQKEAKSFSSDELGIVFDEFTTEIKIDKKIKSYIPKKEYGDPLTFEDIAKESKKGETGIEALGIIKADVDNMGNIIKNSDITENFENFDRFSKGLDAFFSLHVPALLREKYRNIYTVFAGGDDLFLIGAWDEVMEFAREIQKEFKSYVKGKLSISFGIAVAKPSTPVSYLATYTEELLERSKEIDENKDALTIWGETVKWKSYTTVFEALQKVFEKYQDLEASTVYRFLKFCEMSKKAKEGDVKETIWKSKLNYLFSRNLDMKKDGALMEALGKYIEEYPSQTKLFLNEFVYRRRAS